MGAAWMTDGFEDIVVFNFERWFEDSDENMIIRFDDKKEDGRKSFGTFRFKEHWGSDIGSPLAASREKMGDPAGCPLVCWYDS